ncbi:hypothetical protein Pcinc_041571 [Petrolisthes cinctipes]|uniref:Uncharacterized protein n=1 Tax=Petrolisthes cinctipes TaxID=88211 RepID=A0AAE1BKH7_PETCI|nr:hypothetical protein Pcinc_041571 [Petrolisthes cinctipes]
MPSKEELCFLSEAKATTTQDFLSRDIDDLVLEIKENLRLKARPAQLSGGKAKTRASPYSVPSRTESKCGCCEGRRCIRRGLATRRSSDDPYEALQELLKDGDLIKEASPHPPHTADSTRHQSTSHLALGLSSTIPTIYQNFGQHKIPRGPFDFSRSRGRLGFHDSEQKRPRSDSPHTTTLQDDAVAEGYTVRKFGGSKSACASEGPCNQGII